MKRSLAMVAAVLSACGGEEKLPDRPVDMQFRVGVEQLENGCDTTDNYKPLEGYTTVVDVLLRSNGNVNFITNSAFIPGRRLYEDIVLKDGRVDHNTQVENANDELEPSLKGIVTPDRMDVTLTTYEWASSGRCQRKTRLKGGARPLLDPAALDGDYKVHVKDFGFACPGTPRQLQAEGSVLLGVDQYAGSRANFTLGGQLAWGADVPGQDGAMEWTGSLFIQQFFELQGTIKGIFKPGDVDLIMDFGELDDTTGCTSQLFIKGAKRIPSVGSVDNAYRVAIDMNDECGFLGLESTEGTAQLIVQNDGRVALVDPYLDTLVTLKDGALSYSAGSEAEGEVLMLTGNVAPPALDYSVEYKVEMDPGTWCTVAYSASGRARYVFE